jgi:diacylglycerol kinase (ATP)
MTRPTWCVIYNPTAGRGWAGRREAEIRRRLPADTVFMPTTGPGDAVLLATRAADEGFTTVVAGGGDGTVHEVANGLLASTHREARLAVLPLGSMNDYAFTLGVETWWKTGGSWDQLVPRPLDVCVLRWDDRVRHFVNGVGIGFNGMVTIESQKIRWLRGIPLYSLATLRAVARHFASPPMTITLDGQSAVHPTLALSLGIAQREGGFPITALAEPDDGLLDWVHVGDVRRWEMIRHLPNMISGDLPMNHPKLRHGRCGSVAVDSHSPLCVHTDGELACIPADRVTAIQVELLPRRLTVLAYPSNWLGGHTFDSLRQKRTRLTTEQSPV